MSNLDLLNVWYGEVLVGKLWREVTGRIGFRYDSSWIESGFSISQQLPLTPAEYLPSEGKAHQFFVNLLPEAAARIHIVRDLKIADNDFELLKAIGGECAGALVLLPVDHMPNVTPNYKQLDDDALKKILRRKGSVSGLTSYEDRPRLSLAGAQDKCPILFEDDHYFLPQDAAPSTHILKFEITDYRNIPAYEYFLTQLANKIGLPTVACQLKKYDREYFLLIERYDRIVSGPKKVKRLHQEDFCQALGVGYERKYQQEGGPSFRDCYELVQRVSTNPIVDSENLLKWQIFNFLAGNSDGHAKNLSLIYGENEQVRLAPFYDLVCTRAIERIDTKLALSVGGEFDPGKVSIDHWVGLAKACDVRAPYLRALLQKMGETLLDSVAMIREQFEAQHGAYPALQRIQKVVTKQCQRTLKQL